MKRYKIGFFGCGGRGESLAKTFMALGCDVVAGCDLRDSVKEKFLTTAGKDCVWYSDFDEFLSADLDAVVLANSFHEHAPYAIKCFEKGIHVFSECISNATMAEGVELIRAFEKSNSIYMLAENYPQNVNTLEMKRVVDDGSLGKILYAEGEYNHPFNPYDAFFSSEVNYSPDHWRNYLPMSYYITHSLGPVMRISGATPVKVTAFAAFSPTPEDVPTLDRVGDKGAIINTFNDNGSIFKVTGCSAFGGHHTSYRFCGPNGQIENLRGMKDKVMLRYNKWNIPEGREEVNFYEPEFIDPQVELIKKSGHGGADFITIRMFLEYVEKGVQPEFPFDIHSAVTMSSVAILAHRSILNGGQVIDIPDFHKEECRKEYENDRLSPFYGQDGSKPTIPCCSKGTEYKPTDEQIKKYMDIIAEYKKNH